MPYLIRALRGLAVVKLQQIEGALMARDRAGADHGCPRHDQLATQTLVRTFFVIVNERRMAARRCDSPRGTIRSKHSDLTDSTKRSANAFKLGLHAGRTSGVTPLSRSSPPNAVV